MADTETKNEVPLFDFNGPHKRIRGKTDEYNVYEIIATTVDKETELITGSKDIVYKEYQLKADEMPEGVTLADYAKGLRDLYRLVRKYYPEVVQTDYIVAIDHEDQPSIVAIQPKLRGMNAIVAGYMDKAVEEKVIIKQKEFESRWDHVIEDEAWDKIPQYITKTRTIADFNTNNFKYNDDGSVTIFDW